MIMCLEGAVLSAGVQGVYIAYHVLLWEKMVCILYVQLNSIQFAVASIGKTLFNMGARQLWKSVSVASIIICT